MRNTGALEEATVTKHTNEPEPQAEISEPTSTTQPETPEPEITALVSTTTEENVIEGEVIVIDPPESMEDHTLPKQKPYWLLIPFTILLCLVFLTGSLLLPVLTPSATITLIPVEKSISITTTIQVQGSQLPSLTLMQSINVAATGKKYQSARQAAGTSRFITALFLRKPSPPEPL